MSMDSTVNYVSESYVAEPVSEISWGAVIAGALVAAVITLCLFILGTGLGLATLPWFSAPATVKITAQVAIWLVITQWIASAFGGYLTGRLRTHWEELNRNEVFFRDTAHGFLSWIVATLLAAGFVAAAVPAIAHGALNAAMMTNAPNDLNPMGYYVDTLYRGSATADDRDVKTETTRIFTMDARNTAFPDADRTYVAQLVVARTGITPAEATARVDSAITGIENEKEKAKTAAEEARKAGTVFSFASFLSLLVGAFIASVAAVVGGRQRDRV